MIDSNVVLQAVEHAMIRFEKCHCQACHDALRYIQKRIRAEQSKRICCATCKHWKTYPTDCPMCYDQQYDDDGWMDFYTVDNTKEDGTGYCDRYQRWRNEE